MFQISDEDYWATGFPGYDAYVRRPLTEKEKMHVEIYKTLNWSILYGAQGYGKNMAAASKVRERMWALRNSTSVQTEEAAKLPQKICNYRKPRVEWFGTETPKYSLSDGAFHWMVKADVLTVKGLDPKYGLSVFPPMGTTTGRFKDADPFKGRRFIGISESTEWVETRTLDGSSKAWEPQGEIFVMSGKPLKINDKSKEIIEQVKRITYP